MHGRHTFIRLLWTIFSHGIKVITQIGTTYYQTGIYKYYKIIYILYELIIAIRLQQIIFGVYEEPSYGMTVFRLNEYCCGRWQLCTAAQ